MSFQSSRLIAIAVTTTTATLCSKGIHVSCGYAPSSCKPNVSLPCMHLLQEGTDDGVAITQLSFTPARSFQRDGYPVGLPTFHTQPTSTQLPASFQPSCQQPNDENRPPSQSNINPSQAAASLASNETNAPIKKLVRSNGEATHGTAGSLARGCGGPVAVVVRVEVGAGLLMSLGLPGHPLEDGAGE